MNEAAFQGWLTSVAATFGWRCWHVPMPVRAIPGGKLVPAQSGRGLPDLILLHDDPPRLIFAELKGDGGRVSDDQREFLQLVEGLDRSRGEHENEARELSERVGADMACGCPSCLSSDGAVVRGYVWTPADRDQVETILRSKVLA